MIPRDDIEKDGGAGSPAWEQAATEWFFRRDRGLTADEEAELARWLAVDPRHAQALAEIEGSWNDFGRLGEHLAKREDGAAASRERAGETIPLRSAGKIVWLRPLLLTAAAAAVLIGAWIRRPPFMEAPVVASYAATLDAVRSVDLPDGSTVQLNAGSAIEIRFTSDERDVRLLRGEGHFAVAKNAARPFIVDAGAVAVRAVGTAFNVKLRAESLEVLVTEGKVRLISPPASGGRKDAEVTSSSRSGPSGSISPEEQVTLVAGERVIVPRGVAAKAGSVAVQAVAPAEVEQALAWEKRRLEYTDASLGEIVADFNRYNAHKLVIADSELAARRFGATFPTNDYESLVRLLESTFGVTAERRENETILRLP